MSTGRARVAFLGLAALLVGVLFFVSGCGMSVTTLPEEPAGDAAAPAPSGESAPVATPMVAIAPQISEEALRGGEYELRDLGVVRLTDGLYEHPYGEGATQKDSVAFVASARGDLNGDGADDAAVVLAASTGGTGSFYTIVAAVDVEGQALQAGADYLGDRVRIEGLEVADGQIVVNMLVAGPQDPMCCPSQKVVRTYALRSGSLVLESETIAAPTPAQ